MAKLFRGRAKRLVLDVGTSAIRLCELSQTKTGYQLTKYVQREYNSDPALDEEARRGLRRKALGELLTAANVRTRKTILAVPGQSVFTRCRALPPVPEYKVSQIVRYEIQQQIPFGLDQIAMDYQVLDRSEGGGYEVMMAAIKVDVVEKHLSVLEGFRRTIDVVDVAPFAAYNWLKHSGEFGDQGDCVALIDIGATTTDIVVERENQFRNTRPLNIGGNDITQAIAAAFGLNFSDAEKLKRERGFAPAGNPETDGKGGEVIGKVLQRMVAEIMRSFAYFRSLPGGGQVNRVILCGGGACLRNIIPYMQRQLGIEVRIAQPLAGLAISPGAQPVNEHPEQSCVVLGLALRCCEPPPIEINLIPPRMLEVARRKEQAVYWAFSLAALAMIMASVIPVKANENKLVKQRVEELKQYIRLYDPEVVQNPSMPSPLKQKLDWAKNEIDRLGKDVETLDKARVNRSFWLDELSLINEMRPRITDKEGLWFSMVETSTWSARQAPQNQPGGRRRPGGEDGTGTLRRPEGGAFGGIGGGGRAQLGGGAPGLRTGAGFPGIEPRGATGVSARGGPGGRGLMSPDGDGGAPRGGLSAGPGRRGAQPEAQSSPLPVPNAMILNGFATSDVTIKTFVSSLEKATRTLQDGQTLRVSRVNFSEASVQQVPWETLYSAPVGGGMGGRNQPGAGGWNIPTEQRLFSFTIEVVFAKGYGLTEEAPAGEAPAPAPPAPEPPPSNIFRNREQS
jgi:type IV pilus assembly protein PilM